jgi:hypothetical protein
MAYEKSLNARELLKYLTAWGPKAESLFPGAGRRGGGEVMLTAKDMPEGPLLEGTRGRGGDSYLCFYESRHSWVLLGGEAVHPNFYGARTLRFPLPSAPVFKSLNHIRNTTDPCLLGVRIHRALSRRGTLGGYFHKADSGGWGEQDAQPLVPAHPKVGLMMRGGGEMNRAPPRSHPSRPQDFAGRAPGSSPGPGSPPPPPAPRAPPDPRGRGCGQ